MPSGLREDFPDAPTEEQPPAGDGTSHKRTPSGGLLSKLPFLRASATMSSSDTPEEPTEGASSLSPTSSTSPTSPERYRGPVDLPNAAAATMMRKKTRSRKGSLRKTALLGTGRLWRDQLETINSPRLSLPADAMTAQHTREGPLSPLSLDTSSTSSLDGVTDDYPTPRASTDANEPSFTSSYNASGTGSLSKQRNAQKSTSSEEGLVLRASRGRATQSDISTTTDEEESVDGSSGGVALNGATPSPAGLKQLPEDPASYFSFKPGGILRRYSSKKPTPKSPLGSLPMDNSAATPEEWDYSETEWWGWIILIVTWVVFVVGMGSCFGVWSWAWDVGETPYAPPELEDDPTLPIVGYYPALIILTGVMAWVWVIIAWVGMKYFKHAKIPGEDI